jgi:hypothetical protein
VQSLMSRQACRASSGKSLSPEYAYNNCESMWPLIDLARLFGGKHVFIPCSRAEMHLPANPNASFPAAPAAAIPPQITLTREENPGK